LPSVGCEASSASMVGKPLGSGKGGRLEQASRAGDGEARGGWRVILKSTNKC